MSLVNADFKLVLCYQNSSKQSLPLRKILPFRYVYAKIRLGESIKTIQIPLAEYQRLQEELALLKNNELLQTLNKLEDLTEYSINKAWENGRIKIKGKSKFETTTRGSGLLLVKR